jgi:hypothetical protein
MGLFDNLKKKAEKLLKDNISEETLNTLKTQAQQVANDVVENATVAAEWGAKKVDSALTALDKKLEKLMDAPEQPKADDFDDFIKKHFPADFDDIKKVIEEDARARQQEQAAAKKTGPQKITKTVNKAAAKKKAVKTAAEEKKTKAPKTKKAPSARKHR